MAYNPQRLREQEHQGYAPATERHFCHTHQHRRRCHASLMFDDLYGTPVRLDFPFVPAPSGGSMCLFQQEETHECYLVVEQGLHAKHGGFRSGEGHRPGEGGRLCPVRLRLSKKRGGVLEGPSWRAWARVLRDHGVTLVRLNSINEYNLRTYGSLRFEGMLPRPDLHHYFIGGKDASCQLLAERIEAEVSTDRSWGEAVDDVRSRMTW